MVEEALSKITCGEGGAVTRENTTACSGICSWIVESLGEAPALRLPAVQLRDCCGLGLTSRRMTWGGCIGSVLEEDLRWDGKATICAAAVTHSGVNPTRRPSLSRDCALFPLAVTGSLR